MNISKIAFEAMLDRIERMAKSIGAKDQEIYKLQEYVNELEMEPKVHVDPSEQMLTELMTACLTNPDNRIEQIKTLRRVAGIGLQEAKAIVDSIWRKLGKPLPFTCP